MAATYPAKSTDASDPAPRIDLLPRSKAQPSLDVKVAKFAIQQRWAPPATPRTSRCQKCHKLHKERGEGYHSTSCVLLGVKTHLERPTTFASYPMSANMAEHRELGRLIWACFHKRLIENELVRKSLQEKHRDLSVASLSANGSPLREQAPMIWLYWEGADGSRGQTRNADRFRTKWEEIHTIMGSNGRRTPVAWLTISLPSDWPVNALTSAQIGLGEVPRSPAAVPQLISSASPGATMSLSARASQSVLCAPLSETVCEDSSVDDKPNDHPSMMGERAVYTQLGCPSRASSIPTNTIAETKTAEDLVDMRLIWYQRGLSLSSRPR